MSVIWSGITEGGAIVPVQVDETGKVIATAEIREELWAQNGNQLIPVNASNDIATYGKIVLGRASSGTSTLQSPPDAAGEVFTFPKTGGTLAIESDTPTPTGISPFAFVSFLNGVVTTSYNIGQITFTSQRYYQVDYLKSANTFNPCAVVTGAGNVEVRLQSQSSSNCLVGVYSIGSGTPGQNGNFNLIVFEKPPGTKINVPVAYEDPEDDPDYVPEVEIT
jgi:hypothetical protein